MWRGDGDDHTHLADVDPADPVMDRNTAQVVSLDELRGEIGHDLLGHALVRLVLEMDDLATAGVRARRADERRDRARSVVAHLGDGGIDGQRIGRESEVAARHGRDHGHLVADLERLGPLDVRAVARVQKSRRLVSQPKRGPNVTDGCTVLDVDLDGPRTGALPEPGEQSDPYDHANQGIRRLPCVP